MENEKQYIGYDYKEITVSKKLEPAWKDCYTNFGWEMEKSQPAVEKGVWEPLRIMIAPLAVFSGHFFKNMIQDHESVTKSALKMKRNRKIPNKEHLEKSKALGASVAAYIIGLLGTVCMALSMFSYLASNMAGCIGFAIPAFLGWILSYVAYVVIKNRREEIVNKEMETKFDAVNEICMQAHKLVASV